MVELDTTPPDEDAVLKEVWNPDNIEVRTELTPLQIESINKLKLMSAIVDNQMLDMHLNNFMKLQKSKMRKSMEEFVSVVRAKREDLMGKGKSFFGNMMG